MTIEKDPGRPHLPTMQENSTTGVRPAAVAGMFYPDHATKLSREIDALLGAPVTSGPPPKALVVPHAGYIYSGATAARAYRLLAPGRGRIRRVVILGPAHRTFVRGAALSGAAHFRTPLGDMPVDRTLGAELAALPFVAIDDDAHAFEHAIEVQLPFIQRMLGEVQVMPIVVGRASPAEVAALVDRAWGGEETLVIVSSDLSHYRSYDEAVRHDRATVERILRCAEDLQGEDACGAVPLNGFLRVARARGLAPRLVDLCNSGDTAGDRRRVVGYCAIAFEAPKDARGAALLGEARGAIADALGVAPRAGALDHPVLGTQGATFVTLTRAGALRGCIGSLVPTRTLREDVRANACAAAFRDPRFSPLSRLEYAEVSVEVSLIGRAEALACSDERDALARMRPGIDGVILEAGGRRATFLPQVWQQLPEPREFLEALKRKAGLPERYWSDTVRLSRYTVEKWCET